MVFNSPEFLVFLILVFVGYWKVLNKNLKAQNLFILCVSYVFYGWWDWRFLSLIALSTLVDYVSALGISNTDNLKVRKRWLFLSVVFNLGMLGIFKYFNFFSIELQELFLKLGFEINGFTLDVLLPVGISFYTFQTMSYTLDVYKGIMQPSKSLVQFGAYVSFFPQLVAGPIERAKELLPQFEKKRTFDFENAKSGLRLIVWGLIKKVAIADSLSPVVNDIFSNYPTSSGATLVLGAVFFAFQIYGDFSGYSDIAIGCAKLLGFELMSNFKFPYFSRDISEFWRRWHISLSTWFRDYLYIPLGGSRGDNPLKIRNVFIIFLVSGFWHGANWTFIIWGALHALFFLPLLLSNRNRKHVSSHLEVSEMSWRTIIRVLTTFMLVCIGWVFFRSETVSDALGYFTAFNLSGYSPFYWYLLLPIGLLLCEWFIRKDEKLERIKLGRFEIPLLGMLLFLIFVLREGATEFIYFQF